MVCPLAQKQPITPRILGHIYLRLNMRSSFDASFRVICLVIIVVCFARAISLLNLHVPLMPPSNSYVWILPFIPGVVLLPLLFTPDSPFSLLRQLKGYPWGSSSSPAIYTRLPPFALLRQLKGLSLGWFFWPCHLYQTPPSLPY